ncbi:11388_t:CDS:10 [Diversispora eburnea]|uniref:11388_t:CDS:1 n=1 Tax=Diversispora eburnea TaxID=1213867 RepID=A0A9N9BFT2_9GLOM|nr:11388_t:CDS:10 [Diversispora eburnea]
MSQSNLKVSANFEKNSRSVPKFEINEQRVKLQRFETPQPAIVIKSSAVTVSRFKIIESAVISPATETVIETTISKFTIKRRRTETENIEQHSDKVENVNNIEVKKCVNIETGKVGNIEVDNNREVEVSNIEMGEVDNRSEKVYSIETGKYIEVDNIETGEMDNIEMGEVGNIETGEIEMEKVGNIEMGEVDNIEAGKVVSLDSSERQTAASSLILHLQNKYEEHLKTNSNPLELNENNDFVGITENMEKLCGPEVAYSLIRLTRGLASSREAARHGFSLALIELLAGFECITYEIVTTLIDEACPIKSAKERDNSDIIFGRVFGLMAIIRSGMLWRKDSSKEEYMDVINNLIFCSKCKQYVREMCYHIIISSIPHDTSFEEDALEHLINVLKEHSKHGINNPDDLNLALAIEYQYPDIVQNNVWKNVVMHSCDTCYIQWKAKPSKIAIGIHQNQENRLHSVWNSIIHLFNLAPGGKIGEDSIEFSDFWKIVVDGCLFDDETPYQRKFWGFQLFEKVINIFPPGRISDVFTSNFMRTLINNSHDDTRYLHKAAIHVLETIENVSEENKTKANVIAKSLLGPNYDQDFDKLSNTKTVKKIFSTMNNEALENYLFHLKGIFLKSNYTDSSEIERQRQWIIEHMYSILKDSQINRSEGWMKFIFDLFMTYGFFTPKENHKDDSDEEMIVYKPKRSNSKGSQKIKKIKESSVIIGAAIPPLSAKTQEYCRTRCFHSLGELVTTRSFEADSVRSMQGNMSNGESWVYYAACKLIEFENDPQVDSLIVLSDEVLEVQRSVYKIMQQIINEKFRKSKEEFKELKKKTVDSDLHYEGFLWLFASSILTLYNEPDEAMDILKDLQLCYTKMFEKSENSKKLKKSKKSNKTSDESYFHNPADVIVDILLGFLVKQSSFLQNVVEHTFKAFCDIITKSSLNLMLDVNAKYQKLHFKQKIIGLLKIFVRTQPTNPLIFELLIPLLELAKSLKTDEVAKSIDHFLNSQVVVSKEVPTQFEDDLVLDIMQQVHEMINKTRNVKFAISCWKISTYLFKSLVRCHKSDENPKLCSQYSNPSIKKAVNIYESSYQRWLTKPDCLPTKSFSQLFDNIPQVPWHLSKIFLGGTDPKSAKNPKRVILAYEISTSAFKHVIPRKKMELADDNSIVKLIQKMRDSLKTTLQFISDERGEKTFDVQAIKIIIKFAILAIKRTSMYLPKEKLTVAWDATNLLSILKKIKELPKHKSSQILGKCVYVPSGNNSQCRCLRFRASNDQYICVACNHDEPENSNIVPIFNPSEATGRYFFRNNKGKRKRVDVPDILNLTATVFCFNETDSNEESLKIP